MNKLTSSLFAVALAGLLLVACNDRKSAETKTEAAVQHTDRYLKARYRDAQRIDSLETLVRDKIKAQVNPDVRLAMYTIQGYEYFAADYPTDSLAPEFMFKAAQLYNGVLGNKKRAVAIYEKLYEKYPEYNKRGFVLFVTGNLYHELNDTTRAIESLQQFVKEYPKHQFTEDARAMISFIRMDDSSRGQVFGAESAAKQQQTKKPL